MRNNYVICVASSIFRFRRSLPSVTIQLAVDAFKVLQDFKAEVSRTVENLKLNGCESAPWFVSFLDSLLLIEHKLALKFAVYNNSGT